MSKHEHIKTTDKNWSASEYQCVCGFITKDFGIFKHHIVEENSKITKDVTTKGEKYTELVKQKELRDCPENWYVWSLCWQARDAEIELLKAINDHINYQLKKVTEQAIEQKQRIKELEERLDSYDQIE